MNSMLFGQSQFKNPKRVDVAGLRRQLMPSVLLLALCLGLYSFSNSRGPKEPSSQTLPEPSITVDLTPVADPDPFVENPDGVADAAAQDRTAEVSETALIYLFHKLRTHSGMKETPVLSGHHGEDVWGALIADPDKYRGQLVEVEGMLVAVKPNRYPLQLEGLDFPNPSGLDRYFISHLYATNGQERKYFKVATFQKADELYHHELVRVRAYFCQLYTSDVVVGGELKKGTIPVLVGAHYTQVPRLVSNDSLQDTVVMIVLVLPVVVVALIMFFQSRSSSKRRPRLGRAPRRGSPAGASAKSAPAAAQAEPNADSSLIADSPVDSESGSREEA